MRGFAAALICAAACTASEPSEATYPGAVGPNVPLFDKGYLIYLRQPNRLQVFRPGGDSAIDMELACPGTGACSATGVAADSRGNVAVSFGYWKATGRGAGIRILGPGGREVRFIETHAYLATALSFDGADNLWTFGWQRE